jgi:hypothetical protein
VFDLMPQTLEIGANQRGDARVVFDEQDVHTTSTNPLRIVASERAKRHSVQERAGLENDWKTRLSA